MSFQQSAQAHGARSIGAFSSFTNFFRIPIDTIPEPMHPMGFIVIPAPYRDSSDATNFILRQRFTFPDGSRGLPATFEGAAYERKDSQAAVEGVGLYDTSLAVISLTETNHLAEAKSILDNYLKGHYGDMELRAFPSGDNGGAFGRFDSEVHYFFDFTRASGKWDSSWMLWDTHTGPNAWLALALTRYISAAKNAGNSAASQQPYLSAATRIGDAMIRLQDTAAQGAVRYGYSSMYNALNELNTENNLSALAAFRALAALTGEQRFTDAAQKIMDWLANAEVYNTLTGQAQKGMMDPDSGLFYKGLEFKNGRWEVQTEVNQAGEIVTAFAADSGGTWAISSLGPQQIDQVWGSGAALKMWQTVRRRFGRTHLTDDRGAQIMRPVIDESRIDGIDFSDLFSPQEGLISPEWTAGAVFAVRALARYYSSGGLPEELRSALDRDADSMSTFLKTCPSSYAIGPGLVNFRQGQTGFGWSAPPLGVQAMAGIYATLATDPLAWARTGS